MEAGKDLANETYSWGGGTVPVLLSWILFPIKYL